MIISRLGGITAPNDTDLFQPDKVESLYVADGAITSGSCVCQDVGDTTGKKVVTSTVATDHRAAGVYEGKGGRGADNASYGGQDAVAGNVIKVTVYGTVEKARLDGGASNVADGDALTPDDSGDLIVVGSALAAGIPAAFIALEANSVVTAPHPVKVRCM